jgi:YD repeat-containing protein
VSAVYTPTDVDQTKEHQSLYGYDAKHRLTSITHRLCTISTGPSCSSTTATGSVSYEYDDSDNCKRVTEDNGNTSTDFRYCHDARNQLIVGTLTPDGFLQLGSGLPPRHRT